VKENTALGPYVVEHTSHILSTTVIYCKKTKTTTTNEEKTETTNIGDNSTKIFIYIAQ